MGPILPYVIGLLIVGASHFLRSVGPLLLLVGTVAVLIDGAGRTVNAAARAIGFGNVFAFDSDIHREVAKNSVLRTGFYVDDEVDYAHVFGTLTNGSSRGMTNLWIECRVDVADWSGAEKINLMGRVGRRTFVLQPGASIDFDIAATSVTSDARIGDGHCQLAFKAVGVPLDTTSRVIRHARA